MSDIDLAALRRDHFDPEGSATVTDAWEGVTLYTSWGYGQTNVEFAQIVDVSESGKTVVCRLVEGRTTVRERGTRRVAPSESQYGESFRLHVRSAGDAPSFRGSYPHATGNVDDGTRKAHFTPISTDDDVHQTPAQFGH